MEKTLKHNGVTMRYTDTGEGAATVILMHGWGCTAETVESIRQRLAARHRVLTVDLPGHGKSTEPSLLPDGQPWGVNEYTETIEALALQEGIEAPILVGHSYGGRIGILYASRNKVEKMVLIDAAGVKPRRQLSYYLKVYSFKLSKWISRLLLGKEKAAARIEAMRARRGSADYRNSSPMMRRVMSRSVNQDLCKYMPLIKAPTLLMWGENDTATPIADAHKMEKLIPGAGLVTFAGCGHYSFLDNPRAFGMVLDNFL
ncbi:MAG: alpha/beta hydrolase [Muribaculaceae bacterium]|nr:alpha/beta hydrolase [Muribaculaceae bacterium]